MKKIITVVLLLVGIGLIGFAGYGYFFSEDQARCDRFQSQAQAKLNEAMAAKGTPQEAALVKEALGMSDFANKVCRDAGHFYQKVNLMGLGGLTAIIVSIVMLVVSRKRTT